MINFLPYSRFYHAAKIFNINNVLSSLSIPPYLNRFRINCQFYQFSIANISFHTIYIIILLRKPTIYIRTAKNCITYIKLMLIYFYKFNSCNFADHINRVIIFVVKRIRRIRIQPSRYVIFPRPCQITMSLCKNNLFYTIFSTILQHI